jgi:hypothetical protein
MAVSRTQPGLVIRPPFGDEYTVVVQGAFRGGTSIIAQIVHFLGIPLGERFCYGDETEESEYLNVEDVEFQQLLHNTDLLIAERPEPAHFPAERFQALEALIARRNAKSSRWGWKYPANAFWTANTQLLSLLRNPRLISIFRDPVAVATHELELRSHEADPAARCPLINFQFVEREYEMLRKSVTEFNYPHLVVSYERALAKKDQSLRLLIEQVAGFLGLEKSPMELSQVLARVLSVKQSKAA